MNREIDLQSPLVSIVVITYNQEHCLGKTLDSLLAQQCGFDYEIIVSDDCSKDHTQDVISVYASRHACVKPFVTPKNLGLVGN